MNAPRNLTLTERDDKRPLKPRCDEFFKAFRMLRRTDVWKRHVRGGVAVFEVKFNEKAQSWHPHLHLVIDGDFFPHKLLYAEWTRLIGKDGTTDLTACHDRARSAMYLGSYLAKDSKISAWPFERIAEFATAMHRRRLVMTFGKCHNLNIDISDEEPERPPIPSSIISFAALRDAVIAGVEPARKAAPLLARMGGAWRQLFVEFAPPADVEVDVLTAEQTGELARWIDELNGLLLCEKIEEAPPQAAEIQGQMHFHGDSGG